MRYSIIIIAFTFLFSCQEPINLPASKPDKEKVAAPKVKNDSNIKSTSKNYQSIVNRIPLDKSGVATRFQIYRLNELFGEGEILSKPYKVGDRDLEIVGIAVDDVASVPAHSVYLNLNGTYLPTNYGGNSEAFAKTSGNPKYNRCAFKITLPNKRLKKGLNEIRIVVVGKNQNYKFVPGRVYKIEK